MKNLIKISALLFLILLASCNSGLNENYSSSTYKNEQRVKLLNDGIDTLTIKMIDFELLYNDTLEGVTFNEISEMGNQRHSKIVNDIEKEFQTAKENNKTANELNNILNKLKKYDKKNDLISSGLDYVEKLKFSTIN